MTTMNKLGLKIVIFIYSKWNIVCKMKNVIIIIISILSAMEYCFYIFHNMYK